jgi:hypothetical protein
MKATIAFIAMFFLMTSAFISADVYILQNNHSDEYYDLGVPRPANDSLRETWIGEGKLARITDTKKIIADFPAKKLFIVNLREKTYIQTDLPLVWEKFVEPSILGAIRNFAVTGTVEPLKKRKKIKDWNCTSFRLNTWINYQNTRLNDMDMTLWLTEDVDAGPHYKDFRNVVLKLTNYSDELLEKVQVMNGVPVLVEITLHDLGNVRKMRNEVREISQKKAPPGTYGIPEGFKPKERMSARDLRN